MGVTICNIFLDMQGDWRGIPSYEGGYWDEMRLVANAIPVEDIEKARIAACSDHDYTMTDLRKDLKELKKIIKHLFIIMQMLIQTKEQKECTAIVMILQDYGVIERK